MVTRTGRAEVATDPVGPDETEVRVKLRAKEEWKTAHDLYRLGEALKHAVEAEGPAPFGGRLAAHRGSRGPAPAGLEGGRGGQALRPRSGDAEETADQVGKVMRGVAGRADRACSACWACRCSTSRPIACAWRATACPPTACWRGRGLPRRPPHRQGLRGPATVRPRSCCRPRRSARGLRRAAVGTPRTSRAPGAGRDDLRYGRARRDSPRGLGTPGPGRGQRARSRIGELRGRGEAPGGETVELPEGVTPGLGRPVRELRARKRSPRHRGAVALGMIFGMLFLMFGELRYGWRSSPACRWRWWAAWWRCGYAGCLLDSGGRGFIALAGVAVLNGVVMASELQRRLQGQTASATPGRRGAPRRSCAR